MGGIVSYGAYVPFARLDRNAIAGALGTPAGRGTRAVASYDEDTTSMAVEAGRAALAAAPDGLRVQQLNFATANPAYLDKTNASAIHATLGLDPSVAAYDMVGSVRSGMGAVRAAFDAANAGRTTLAVLSDIRTGLPGGADERDGGDAAVAFLYSNEGPALADVLGGASSTGEFLDRWRIPGEPASKVWEERFGEAALVPLAEAAITDAFKQAGMQPSDIDHLIVAGTHARAARRIAASVGAKADALVDDLTAVIGNTGTAQPGLLMASVLDRAKPGEVIVLVTLADGAEVRVLKTTEALSQYQAAQAASGQLTVAQQIAAAGPAIPYASFLTWRGMLTREPPRRPDPERPAAPPSLRHDNWKFGFVGSRCENCGTRHLPPQRVCVNCQAIDQMAPERLADVAATVATFTVDRLAFSLSPPVVAAVIDFDGGGRFQCELTDVDPGTVKIGDRVQMTFRRLFTADGVHNYFWKARPLIEQSQQEEAS